MKQRFPRLTLTALFLAGAIIVAIWVRYAGGPELLDAMRQLGLVHGAALLAITASCLFLRFLRWQYLLRRLGIRVPTRPSMSIYLASLAGIATPAYVGETLRCALLRRHYGVPIRLTLPVWLVERAMDFAAIGLLGAAALTHSWIVMGSLGAVALLIAVFVRGAPGERLPEGGPLARLRDVRAVLPVLALSVLAWLPAAFVVTVSALGLNVPLDPVAGARVFAAATLGGGLSLMPAGMAATGSLAIVQLEGLGIALTSAVAVVSVYRLFTAGITLAIGGIFLVLESRRLRVRTDEPIHFDAIASEYLDQFSPHIWDLLLKRKTALLQSALGPASGAGTGLDLGCGLGLQASALRERGYRVIGLDPAYGLVHEAGARGLPAVTGSALELPFADGSIDFVYTVGVLHHLGGQAEQRAACSEVARVLRPGGLFVVHETNPRNPLFRLYMSYLFPILRSIDEGIEHWIDPAYWGSADGLRVERVEFFTFLPDFLPRPLLRAALGIERWLEHSAARMYSVHYMAVVRRPSVTEPVTGSTMAAAESGAS
ncbi:MAG TPA: lysylphosphatidylglycerol synthase domain-containing protein [Gemmatimonadaceae bacterium]|nr:lysylphosphatidylglycerol synthase domain-containing protein [Gemmatimonadaceae bacterium]